MDILAGTNPSWKGPTNTFLVDTDTIGTMSVDLLKSYDSLYFWFGATDSCPIPVSQIEKVDSFYEQKRLEMIICEEIPNVPKAVATDIRLIRVLSELLMQYPDGNYIIISNKTGYGNVAERANLGGAHVIWMNKQDAFEKYLMKH